MSQPESPESPELKRFTPRKLQPVPLEWLRSPPVGPPSPDGAVCPCTSILISSISQKLDQGRQYSSNNWAELSIYRVPKPIHDVDETAYTPQIVAIGPYHHEESHLRDMERHKWRALHRALEREGHMHELGRYLEVGRSLELRARACYEPDLNISTDEFVQSLVVDAIFVLELFRGVYNKETGFPGLRYNPRDPVFTVPGIMILLQRDMIKLENQLPFFVLDSILALQQEYSPELLARLALAFFNNLMPANTCRPSDEFFNSITYKDKAVHCLDFFRHSLLFEGPENPGVKQVDNVQYLNHSVTELCAAGFEFRPVESVRFWDIKFKKGVLYIPRLQVHDTTKSLFLNLIAFEQSHLKCNRHISTYVIFMDRLINSEEDVRFLHHKRIIEHFLENDREVADLFNLLCKDVTFKIEECYLFDLFKQVNIYYNRRWNTWRATFVQKYVKNPWTIISLVAAIILLLLTFLQTFYGIYSYHKPN